MPEDEILKGVIYSKFEDIGPMAIAWYPKEIVPDTLRLISLKSITILTGEEGQVPESFATIPFVNIGRTGLVKYIELKDPKARGGARDCSLTIIFDDKYNSVIYKYMNTFLERLNDFSNKISEMENEGNISQLKETLGEFYKEILNTLNELQKSEERQQFPTQKEIKSKTKYRFKIIVVGDPEVGKTSLILRYVDRAFKKLYVPTIGVQVSTKQVSFEKDNVELVIWDIAGQEKFDSMRRLFYEGADGVFFVYDVTNKQTFVNVANWYKDVQQNLERKWKGILLANKVDLKDARIIGTQAGETIAAKTGLDYLETSAKNGQSVDEMFNLITKRILEKD